MLGKIEILAVILILVLLFYFVISLGAGAFSKKETNSRTKKYLKSVERDMRRDLGPLTKKQKEILSA